MFRARHSSDDIMLAPAIAAITFQGYLQSLYTDSGVRPENVYRPAVVSINQSSLCVCPHLVSLRHADDRFC